MEDKLVKALALDGKVRIFAVETTKMVDQARVQHDMWPTSTAALGRLMSAASMMAANLKEENEKIQLSINGGGPIGTVFAEAKGNGSVKGFVGDPHVYITYNESKKLAVGKGVGNAGYLKVTRDINRKDAKESKFTSTVELLSGEIAEDVAYYYVTSEQTPSLVSLGVLVDPENVCIASGGLMIQMMPGHTDEDITKVEELTKGLEPISTLIDSGKTPSKIIIDIFEDAKILETKTIQLHCDCSEIRMKAAISTMESKDIIAMIEEDHGCEVKCEFCNTDYKFSEEDLKSILSFKQTTCGK
jgi:molecular chaperone Hsp33